MVIKNNEEKRKFIGVISLFSICLIIFTVNVFADINDGSIPGQGSEHNDCGSGCAMTSDSSYQYGYRVYLLDNEGDVLARSNAINNQGRLDFSIFSGSKIRKEVVNVGNSSIKTATSDNYTPTNMFEQFYSDTADFNEVFIDAVNLINDPDNAGSYCSSRNGVECVDLTKDADKQYMLGKLQSFLNDVGIIYEAEDLYDAWLTAEGEESKNIYLGAEALEAVKTSADGFVVGTCTELIYYAWQQGYDSSNSQNGVLLELCGTGTLTKFSGAGYYATSKNYTTGWQSYGSSIFTRITSGKIVDHEVEGISVFLWKISDIFGSKTCPVDVPESERCSLENYNTAGCCSCEKAAALETSGVDVPDTVTDSYDYYPICNNDPPSCEYKLETTIPNTCVSDGNSGYVGDKASWKCTFTSTKSGNDTSVKNNYYFSAFSNSYCTIYCQEQIEFTLPGSGAYTDAGTYLIISASSGYQTLGPIRYKGTSTCRTTSSTGSEDGTINLTKFYEDFDAANKEVRVAFDNWQYAELQNEVINAATSHSWSETCSNSWCVDWEPNVCAEGVESCGSYCADTDSCSESQSGTYYTYNNKTYYGATFTLSTNISNGGCSCTTSCGSSCTAKKDPISVGVLKQKYNAAVTKRAAVLEELKKCNNFYRSYVEFKPIVSFYYEDDLYENTYELKASGTASSVTNYFMTGDATGTASSSTKTKVNSLTNDSSDSATYYANSTSVNGNSSSIEYYNCGNEVTKTGCSATSYYEYPTNKWFEQITSRTYSYSLPDNVNQYVNKPSGQSTDSPISENYDFIQFSNLPVHYSTSAGTYKYTITTKSFGNNNKFDKFIMDNKKFNSVSYSSDNKYECTYKVACEKTIICGENSCDDSCITTGDDDDDDDTPSGTDLIYRTISLYYPFPGQNATSSNIREAGKNWQTFYDNDVVSEFIYNNRGTSYYELYNLEPMYEITLTPALMRKIKNYNNQQNHETEEYYSGTKKEFTASLGYSDFTLICEVGSDGEKSGKCTSSIIRDWGVTGCAISGSENTNCGNTVAW